MHILICASEANTRMERYNLSLVYVWPGKQKRTLTLYRLMKKNVYCPFNIRLKRIV